MSSEDIAALGDKIIALRDANDKAKEALAARDTALRNFNELAMAMAGESPLADKPSVEVLEDLPLIEPAAAPVPHKVAGELNRLEERVGPEITNHIKELLPEEFHATFNLMVDGEETVAYARIHAPLILGDSFHLDFDGTDFEPILNDDRRRELTALMKNGTFKRPVDKRSGAYDDEVAFEGGDIHLTAEPSTKRART